MNRPYNCHLCGTSSVHQICLPCEDLFKRGLKTRLSITQMKYKKVDIHSIKYNIGKWLTTNRELPKSIIMNNPTYQVYCVTNTTLPSSPPHKKGDSLHHVHGIPISIVDVKGFGYDFSDTSYEA